MSDEALFGDDGLRVGVVEDADAALTAGERLRRRQAARIATGLHPLSFGGARIRLHQDAPRDAAKDDGRIYPRCGKCAHRFLMGYHNRSYPKCGLGAPAGRLWAAPRASNGEASDVRAWWPACVDYSPAEVAS